LFLNLLVLFICLNFSIGMVTGIEGLPTYIDPAGQNCQLYDPDGVPVDPAVNIESGQGTTFDDMDDLVDRIQHPTEDTETAEGVWSGVTTWWNSTVDAASAGWSSMSTMMNMVSGAYIFDIMENISISCHLDNRAYLTTATMTDGNGDTCATLSLTVPCENPTHEIMIETNNTTCLDEDPTSATYNTQIPCNYVWEELKMGVNVIFTFLLAITLFYWLTGRGHILSS